jgi:hypothetical protein
MLLELKSVREIKNNIDKNESAAKKVVFLRTLFK